MFVRHKKFHLTHVTHSQTHRGTQTGLNQAKTSHIPYLDELSNGGQTPVLRTNEEEMFKIGHVQIPLLIPKDGIILSMHLFYFICFYFILFYFINIISRMKHTDVCDWRLFVVMNTFRPLYVNLFSMSDFHTPAVPRRRIAICSPRPLLRLLEAGHISTVDDDYDDDDVDDDEGCHGWVGCF